MSTVTHDVAPINKETEKLVQQEQPPQTTPGDPNPYCEFIFYNNNSKVTWPLIERRGELQTFTLFATPLIKRPPFSVGSL